MVILSKCLPNRALIDVRDVFDKMKQYHLVRKPDSFSKFEDWFIRNIQKFPFSTAYNIDRQDQTNVCQSSTNFVDSVSKDF